MIAKTLFSQPIRCKIRSLLFMSRTKIFPRLSPQLTFAMIGRSESWVLFRPEKNGSCICDAQAHWDERNNRAMQRTRVATEYAEGSQPSDNIYQSVHEWNNITVLRYSPYRLQPTRLQPSELYMWHSVAGQVAQEDTKYGDCSYMRWASEHARETIGETHAWRCQLRWAIWLSI